MTTKQIHLNAFEMNCVGHLARGMWRHPDDGRFRFNDLDYWIEEAQLLEQGLFDSMFIADVLGTYETAPGDSDRALRAGHQTPRNDPLLIVPAMAAATRHLGFAVTISTTYEPPFSHAQRLSTVDHLTKGRVGWNVVTSYLDNAARNFGLDGQIEHDDRYDRADEFLDVCYKLWEGSWDDGAVLRDRENGVYADPEKVHYINHVGRHYRVAGPHLAEPSPQRTPVIVQATASPRGKQFAGRHAEAVFLGSSSEEQVRDDIAEIRRLAEESGRDGRQVKIFNHLRFITGRTTEEVQRKAEDYARYRLFDSRTFGVDLTKYDPNTYLDQVWVPPRDGAGRDRGRMLKGLAASFPIRPTVGELLEQVRLQGGAGPFVMVGTPEQIVDRIEHLVEFTDLDGFNVHSNISTRSYRDFVELVVPELQRRGLFRTRYDKAETTFRERLFGAGHRLLPEGHPGAAYRGAFHRSTVQEDAAS